jgi:hypothetical protein
VDANELSKLSYLWTTEAKNYVLWHSADDPDWRNSSIFDINTRGIVIIEDDELFCQVIEKMYQAGVPTVRTLPPDPEPIGIVIDQMFAAGATLEEINRKRRELLDLREKQRK